MRAIFKREFQSYFHSMVGYVFVAVVLFFTGVYFMAYNLFQGYPSFGYTLMSSTIIYMVAVPILTMRSMAEERKSKTDQMLLTAPVSLTEVVLGKFFAMAAVLLIPVAVMCVCPLIIQLGGGGNPGADYAAILAFYLMGCVFIAVGMFISALTESQIIAAVGTFAVLLVIYLWGDLTGFLPDKVSSLLSAFDFQGVIKNFAYYNVFDIGGLVLYLSMTALMIFATVMVLKKRRGGMIAAVTAVVVAICVVVNMAVGQLPSNVLQKDISDNSLYTVSDTAKEYLAGLDTDVDIIILAQKDNIDERITKFVDNYVALSDHLKLTTIDPVAHPSALTDYNATENSIVVKCESTGRSQNITFDEILVPDYSSYYYGNSSSVDYTSFDADGQLTSAIDSVTSENSEMIYLLQNHGESTLATAVTDAIDKANLQTGTLSLMKNNGVPDDCSLILCYAPTSDLADSEKTMLEDYLSGGGKLMVLFGDTVDLPNWQALLKEYGLTLEDGYIGDTQSYYTQFQSAYYFNATLSSSNSITSSFGDSDLNLVYGVHGMTQVTPARGTITVDPFMTTSENGGYNDSTKQTATYVLGAVASEDTDGGTAQLTAISAATLIDSDVLSSYSNLINLKIFMNALTNGMESVSNISIPAVSLSVTYNTFTNAGLISILFVGVLPVGTLIGGLIYWIKRRKR